MNSYRSHYSVVICFEEKKTKNYDFFNQTLRILGFQKIAVLNFGGRNFFPDGGRNSQ